MPVNKGTNVAKREKKARAYFFLKKRYPIIISAIIDMLAEKHLQNAHENLSKRASKRAPYTDAKPFGYEKMLTHHQSAHKDEE